MAEPPYGRLSLWRDPARFDEALGRERAARLEVRGRAADEIATRAAYLDLFGVGPGARVLEVGCGSGVVLRDLARRVAPDGLAVGLDLSPVLLRVAREQARDAGLAAVVDLQEGDARALPFATGAFDAVLAATTLCHIPGAERAVPELVRVTRPGGTVGVFEIDGDSLIIAHPDRALTRRIVAARSDQAQVDSWLARRLPGLFADAGLHDIRVHAFTPFDREPKGFNASLAELGAAIAAQVGTVTEAERERWLDQLHAEQAAGRSVAGLTHLFIWATVPEPPEHPV